MINNNFATYSIKILAEFARDLLFFPLWWYSQGLYLFSKKVLLFLNDQQKSLALWVWIKNIFRPMYGQSDWQGIAISIFMRIVQIILRSIAMLFWLILSILELIAWIFAPLFALYQIFFQIAL